MKYRKLYNYLFIFLNLLANNYGFAQEEFLDISFGEGGKVTTDLNNNSEAALGATIDSYGKIIVVGHTSHKSYDNNFALVRYNSNGSLDNTFGLNGIVITDLGTYNESAKSVISQADNKIIVAGSRIHGTYYDFVLLRYNYDGSIDSTFGVKGQVLTSIGNWDDHIKAAAVQNDGKIIVVGYTYNGYNDDLAIVRYNKDGTLDTTFGTLGIIKSDVGGGDNFATSLNIQSDGKILVAGGSRYGFTLGRYNNDGSLDYLFDNDGLVYTSFEYIGGYARAVLCQEDGKIVIAGNCWDGLGTDLVLVRYDIEGSIDINFGLNGKVVTAREDFSIMAHSLFVQNDGSLIVGGETYSGNYDFALIKYDTNGFIDSTLGLNGIVQTDFGSVHDRGYSGTIQPDGKILIVGNNYNGTNYDFALARYSIETKTFVSELTHRNLKVQIYPEVTSGVLFLDFKDLSQARINIYDILGKRLVNMPFHDKGIQEIDLGSLQKGVYFVEILSGDQKLVQKIVRQ